MMLEQLINQSVAQSMSYETYRKLMEQHAMDGTHTGSKITPALTQYSRLNHQRMKRWDKKLNLSKEHEAFLNGLEPEYSFLAITESWCGDAAQTLPMIQKIAARTGINFRLVLRDEHPDLMDQFLTHGNRSIAKLIIYRNSNYEVLQTWGPRPEQLTKLVEQELKERGSLSPAFKEEIQVWYNRDKGKATEADIIQLLRTVSQA